MTIAQYRLLILGIGAAILLVPTAVGACPKCFGLTDQHVLHTYYFSVLFLSAIPFGIIGSILAWLYLHKRRFRHSKQGRGNHNGGIKLR